MTKTQGATRTLAEWIVDPNRPGPTPAEARIAAISIIDTFASAIAATCEPGPWNLLATRSSGEGKPASIWGMGTAASMADAALLNGMLAHMLDYDDGDMLSRMHPSCMLVPAIMVVGESRKLSGAALVDAYLTGYYVIQMIGRIAGKPLANRGFHVTGMIGALGATASVCRLLGLTADQTANALGIVATTVGGLRANFGTDMKPYHAGRAAASAIEAVDMTLAGMTASHDILEARDGFLFTLAGPELAPLLADEVRLLLDGEFSIERNPPNIKLYACCHAMHGCIQALISLRPQLEGRIDEIREIVAEAPTMSKIYVIYPEPKTGLEAKFSMEVGLAVALLDWRGGIEQFTDASIDRPEVRKLSRLVRFETSEYMDEIHARFRMPGKVVVRFDDEELVCEVEDPRGCRSDPCSVDDILAKFAECAAGVLSDEALREMTAMLADFTQLRDVSELSRMLRGGIASAPKMALAEAVG